MKQAKNLNRALAPNPLQFGDFTWLTLIEVKNRETNKKYDLALSIIENWMIMRRERWQKIKDQSSMLVKLIEILMAIIFIGLMTTSLFYLPPASYIIDFYCKIFDTYEYNPTLIAAISSLIVIMPLAYLKKIAQKRTLSNSLNKNVG